MPVKPRTGIHLTAQAVSVLLFLVGHLATAIWFARGVKADVQTLTRDIGVMTETIGAIVVDVRTLVKNDVRETERLLALQSEVDRLRRLHDDGT